MDAPERALGPLLCEGQREQIADLARRPPPRGSGPERLGSGIAQVVVVHERREAELAERAQRVRTGHVAREGFDPAEVRQARPEAGRRRAPVVGGEQEPGRGGGPEDAAPEERERRSGKASRSPAQLTPARAASARCTPARLLAAALAVGAASAWLVLPYLEQRRAGVFPELPHQVFAPASWYLAGGPLFPGWTCLALAAAAWLAPPRAALARGPEDRPRGGGAARGAGSGGAALALARGGAPGPRRGAQP